MPPADRPEVAEAVWEPALDRARLAALARLLCAPAAADEADPEQEPGDASAPT